MNREIDPIPSSKKYGIQGDSTIRNWLKKYGNFDWEDQIPSNIAKSPEQRILELKAEVRLPEKQKAQLENQNHIADSKAIIFDMMINIAEEEYKINVRKNLKHTQSIVSGKKNKKT